MLCQLLVVLLTVSSVRTAAITLKQECLTAHNFYRALHPGTPPMRWNNRLQREAQAYANKLARENNFNHDQDRSNGYYGVQIGENLAYRVGPKSCAQAVKAWYDERKLYNYNYPGFSDGTGHFTQVVWKESTEVGVAMASRDIRMQWGPGTKMVKKWFTVARYKPTGNIGMRGSNQAYRDNVLPPNGQLPPNGELSLTDLRKKIAHMSGTDSPYGDCSNVKSDNECEEMDCNAVLSSGYNSQGSWEKRGYDFCPSTCNKCEEVNGKKKGNGNGSKKRNGNGKKKGNRNRIPEEKAGPPLPALGSCKDTAGYCQLISPQQCSQFIGSSTKCINDHCKTKNIYMRDQCKKKCNNCPRGLSIEADEEDDLAPKRPLKKSSRFTELNYGEQCSPELIITRKSECRLAAIKLYGRVQFDVYDSVMVGPRGCYKYKYLEDDKVNIYFNAGNGDEIDDDSSPICRKSATKAAEVQLMAEKPPTTDAEVESSSPNTFLVVIMCACVIVAIGSVLVAIVMVRKNRKYQQFEVIPGESQGLLAVDGSDEAVSGKYMK